MVIAGIGWQGNATEAYGVLLQQSEEQITVQLRTMPEHSERMQPGQRVAVTLLEPSKLTIVPAEILAAQEGTLELALNQPSKIVYSRRNVRYECVLPISLRDAEDTATSAGWINASALNISMGGMYLVVADDQHIPDHLEARLHLHEASGSAGKKIQDAGGTLQLSARVKNRRPAKDGETGIGIAFDTLQPQQERALAGFIKMMLGHQKQQAA